MPTYVRTCVRKRYVGVKRREKGGVEGERRRGLRVKRATDARTHAPAPLLAHARTRVRLRKDKGEGAGATGQRAKAGTHVRTHGEIGRLQRAAKEATSTETYVGDGDSETRFSTRLTRFVCRTVGSSTYVRWLAAVNIALRTAPDTPPPHRHNLKRPTRRIETGAPQAVTARAASRSRYGSESAE